MSPKSQICPNIVSDAEFNPVFDFANHFAAILLLWFAFRSSQGIYSNSQYISMTFLDFSKFKIDPNIVSDPDFNVDFDFANHLAASLLLWFELRPSQVAS